MKRLFYTLLFFLPCMLIACGGSDDTPDGDPHEKYFAHDKSVHSYYAFCQN